MYRRAVEGVETPVGWYKGNPGAYVREYSDTRLMFRLAARPLARGGPLSLSNVRPRAAELGLLEADLRQLPE